MERTEFLKKCQKAAQAPCGVKNIRRGLLPDTIVELDGAQYYGVGYQMTFDKKGNVQHTAMLHDLKADAIIYVDLGLVKQAKEKTG